MNYSKEEFWDSSFKEIVEMWKAHIEFNGWEIKNNNEENTITDNTKYKRVNIEDIPFL